MNTPNMKHKDISLEEWKEYYLSVIKQLNHNIERVKYARDNVSNQIKLLESIYIRERSNFTSELEAEAYKNRQRKCIECSALNSIIRDMETKNKE